MINKALFLDRDGVINVDRAYVHRICDFEFIEGIFDLCNWFQKRGFLIIVVTNQAGIGRGFYSEQEFSLLTDWMNLQFLIHGVTIKHTYYCPFHPEHGIGRYRADSFNRKPNPGMLLTASHDYKLDLACSVLIGDKESDIVAGINAGISTTILLSAASENILPATRASFVAQSLDEISQWLGQGNSLREGSVLLDRSSQSFK